MKRLMLGNEALAHGAYMAGVRVVSSYPGTPSTEITEAIAKYDGVYAEWAPNEKVALEVALGASFGGARAMACMKHVGLNVAADPLFTASYTGVNGGLVVVVADDPGMHSSQNEQDSRYYAKAAHIPMLEPADSGEAMEYARIAFEMSEKYDTPVLLRMTTRVSHSQSAVEPGERAQIELRPYEKDPMKYVMMPGMARRRHVLVEDRMNRLAGDVKNMDINRIEWRDRKIGVITGGVAYQYVKDALPGASVLKLGVVHPLPMDLIRAFAKGVERLIIAEELEPFIEEQVLAAGIRAEGKSLFSRQGELSASIIANKLLGEKAKTHQEQGAPARPPVMCPGCPHRGIFYLFNKLKLTVTGDIGCYTLGTLAPLHAMDTSVCMGASIGVAMGMEKARGREFARKLVAVIGDSTFIHSGVTGLIEMVYNRSTGTVVIVDNSTTGMTGHQQNPATGKTLRNEDTWPLDLEMLVRAVGVKNVRVVDPFDLAETEKALREEIAREEVSVVIVRRPCALLLKTKDKPLFIQEEACRRCGACLRIGCPAIEKGLDGQMSINPALCNGCGLCAKVCRFGAILKGGEQV